MDLTTNDKMNNESKIQNNSKLLIRMIKIDKKDCNSHNKRYCQKQIPISQFLHEMSDIATDLSARLRNFAIFSIESRRSIC